MHGIVMKGLKDYVVENHDWRAWRSVQERADVERRLYTPAARYPDRHGVELAAAARSMTGADEADLQFQVGRHLVPTLLQVYGVHVDGVRSGLDVLANAEAVVGEALRRKGLDDATPPAVAGERVGEDRVVVRYGGDHCAGLRGVAVGLGEYYDDPYAVTERACQGEGAGRCELVVAREGGGGGAAARDD